MTTNDVPHIASYLLGKHGLTQDGWSFRWDNARRRAGCCWHSRKVISLSRHYVGLNIVDRFDDIVDTILHEIAHALVGPGIGHGQQWKEACIKIGAAPIRICSAEVVLPTGKYKAQCLCCGKEYRRHKPHRSKNGSYLYCTKCGPDHGRLEFRLSVEDTPTTFTTPAQTPPPRRPRTLRGDT